MRDEQPMPETTTTSCGGTCSFASALVIAAQHRVVAAARAPDRLVRRLVVRRGHAAGRRRCRSCGVSCRGRRHPSTSTIAAASSPGRSGSGPGRWKLGGLARQVVASRAGSDRAARRGSARRPARAQRRRAPPRAGPGCAGASSRIATRRTATPLRRGARDRLAHRGGRRAEGDHRGVAVAFDVGPVAP